MKIVVQDENGFISDAGQVMVEHSDGKQEHLPRFAVWKMDPYKRKLQVCFVSDELEQCKEFLKSSYSTESEYEYALEHHEQEAMNIDQKK